MDLKKNQEIIQDSELPKIGLLSNEIPKASRGFTQNNQREIVETSKKIDGTKKKFPKLFQGRNIIKKVKTNCLKTFIKIIKDCVDLPFQTDFKLKINEKINLYRIFKSDISKFRNKLILNHSMKVILNTFSDLNFEIDAKIKADKKLRFNFMMNCKWIDFLFYVKRNSKEIFSYSSNKEFVVEVTSNEISQYLDYVNKGSSSKLKERINLDKNYLILYEPFIEKYLQTKDSPMKDYKNITNRMDSLINKYINKLCGNKSFSY